MGGSWSSKRRSGTSTGSTRTSMGRSKSKYRPDEQVVTKQKSGRSWWPWGRSKRGSAKTPKVAPTQNVVPLYLKRTKMLPRPLQDVSYWTSNDLFVEDYQIAVNALMVLEDHIAGLDISHFEQNAHNPDIQELAQKYVYCKRRGDKILNDAVENGKLGRWLEMVNVHKNMAKSPRQYGDLNVSAMRLFKNLQILEGQFRNDAASFEWLRRELMLSNEFYKMQTEMSSLGVGGATPFQDRIAPSSFESKPHESLLAEEAQYEVMEQKHRKLTEIRHRLEIEAMSIGLGYLDRDYSGGLTDVEASQYQITPAMFRILDSAMDGSISATDLEIGVLELEARIKEINLNIAELNRNKVQWSQETSQRSSRAKDQETGFFNFESLEVRLSETDRRLKFLMKERTEKVEILHSIREVFIRAFNVNVVDTTPASVDSVRQFVQMANMVKFQALTPGVDRFTVISPTTAEVIHPHLDTAEIGKLEADEARLAASHLASVGVAPQQTGRPVDVSDRYATVGPQLGPQVDLGGAQAQQFDPTSQRLVGVGDQTQMPGGGGEQGFVSDSGRGLGQQQTLPQQYSVGGDQGFTPDSGHGKNVDMGYTPRDWKGGPSEQEYGNITPQDYSYGQNQQPSGFDTIGSNEPVQDQSGYRVGGQRRPSLSVVEGY